MLKVGLLLDSVEVPRWIAELVDEVKEMEGVCINLLILNESVKKPKSLTKTFVYRMLRNLDRKAMPVRHNPFQKKRIQLPSAEIVAVTPVSTAFSDRFPDDSIDQIKAHGCDILLRFGFRILRGDILKAAKYGILSLHHGDTNSYRGGPPAFWEWVNKEPVTAVSVQLLTEQLDGGNVLGKTFLRTDHNSMYRNQAKLYWAGKELMIDAIRKIKMVAPSIHNPHEPEGNYYSYPLYRNPGNWVSLKILAGWLWRNLYRKTWDLFCIRQWQLIYSIGSPMAAPFYRFKTLVPAADRIWADPFVIKKDSAYFLFFEEKKFNNNKAHISCLELDKKGNPKTKDPTVVLKEDHHLSYPFLFTHNGEDYMIPESGAINKVVLYKCNSFPGEWKEFGTLLSGFPAFDSTLHYHNGLWYLFCSAKQDDRLSSDAYLHIYWSKDFLTEPFQPHAMNPICRDVRLARPAGRIFEKQGIYYRPSQVSAPNYGSGIQLNRIIELSPDLFKEEPVEILQPEWDKKLMGMHTINITDGITVADIQKKRSRWG